MQKIIRLTFADCLDQGRVNNGILHDTSPELLEKFSSMLPHLTIYAKGHIHWM